MITIDNRESAFDRVIALGEQSILMCTKAEDNIFEALAKAKSDDEVSKLLKGNVRIEYASIVQVVGNMQSEMVYIKYKENRKKAFQTVGCQDKETAEKLLSALKEKLPDFSEKQKQLGRFESSVKPAIFVVVNAFLTHLFVGMAAEVVSKNAEIDVGQRKVFIKKMLIWVLDLLGPTGVAIVGGLITLSLIAWLVSRIKNPPLIRTLYKK